MPFFGYTLGSISWMVNGVRFLVIGYTGSAKIYGWAAFSSFNSSCEPLNFASCACSPWADQCVKLRSPTCSTNARYTVDTRAILSNCLADMHSQARADSNTIAPSDDKYRRNDANGLAMQPWFVSQVCLQHLQTWGSPLDRSGPSSNATPQEGHTVSHNLQPAQRAEEPSYTHCSTVQRAF